MITEEIFHNMKFRFESYVSQRDGIIEAIESGQSIAAEHIEALIVLADDLIGSALQLSAKQGVEIETMQEIHMQTAPFYSNHTAGATC